MTGEVAKCEYPDPLRRISGRLPHQSLFASLRTVLQTCSFNGYFSPFTTSLYAYQYFGTTSNAKGKADNAGGRGSIGLLYAGTTLTGL
ncbi:hypothetical protein BU23DRAFT_257276 [Bimuria novae-zelandiae CBS 107.79]|uniref:Uncharacterized protein n=1 Tax=Bimuria novae-zelandiae CBS 107.79 TaxID=1447943 RepID=A0A6A5UVX4_9PLEO|nr:hypothetical protein BU23DRAFT_257276 [Bimuria novae-zelandiae CBS 107.79]